MDATASSSTHCILSRLQTLAARLQVIICCCETLAIIVYKQESSLFHAVMLSLAFCCKLCGMIYQSANSEHFIILHHLFIGLVCMLQINSRTVLQEMAAILEESDVSPFELLHSNIVSSLLSFLTAPTPDRDTRLRQFLHVFYNCPV